MLDLRDDIVHLINNAAPPLDVHKIAKRARGRRRRARTLIAGGAATALLAATFTIALLPTTGSRPWRVTTHGDSTTTLAGAPLPPLTYQDRTKPPPLRIESGGRSVDITTELGCWGSPPIAGITRMVCADGAVDPAQFVLRDTGARHLTIQSPIPCQITVQVASPPPPHGPRELAASPVNPEPLPVDSAGTNRWSVELPTRTGPTAIYINLVADFRQGAESGNASYGFELGRR